MAKSGMHTEGLGAVTGSAAHAESRGTASGQESHAEGHNATASGFYAHAEGDTTVASGSGAHAEGEAGTASGTASHAEGASGIASGYAAHVEGGNCTASSNYSHAEGYYALAARNYQHAKASGRFTVTGDAQITNVVARRETTDATPLLLTFNGSGTVTLTGASINVLTIPVGRAHRVRIEAIARRTDTTGEYAGWTITFTLVRDATGNARITTPVVVTDTDGAGAATWTLVPTVDTSDATNNFLALTATGEAAKTIRWVAGLWTVEVG